MKSIIPLTISLWLCLLGAVTEAANPSENEIDGHLQDTQHPNVKSPASELFDEVDILKLLNVSSKDQGVSVIEGPVAKFPAYKFRLQYGNGPISKSSDVASAMNNTNGFTVVFVTRQQRNNLGTLMSVNSPGRLTPWFELTSNSKTGILTMKYRVKGTSKIDWILPKHHRRSPLAAWTWMSVSVDYRTGLVRMDLDCKISKFQPLTSGKRPSKIAVPTDSLVYFGQEPGRKKKFLGSMQVAKVLPYVVENRMWSCLQISDNLSPEFQKPMI